MHHRNLVKNTSGVAIIEFALILPVLLLILLGVVEFGVYFMKEQIVQRTVSTTASAIQLDPNNEMNKDNAYNSGTSLVDYTVNGNYICAKSYSSSSDAKAGLCNANDGWVTTTPPDDKTGAPYYVALVAYVQESSFTELFKRYIPPITVTSVFKVGNSGTGPVYGFSTLTYAYRGPWPTVCRIKSADGTVTCKWSHDATDWTAMDSPFPTAATDTGPYGLQCETAATDATTFGMCCRVNLTTGASECQKYLFYGSYYQWQATSAPF